MTLKLVTTTAVMRIVLATVPATALATALAMVTAPPMAAGAAEEDTSANALLPYCKIASGQAGAKAYLVGRCVGTVQGVADTLSLVKQADAQNNIVQLCVDRPKSADTGQAVEAVVKYGDAHPDQTRAPLTVVTALALTEAWACKK